MLKPRDYQTIAINKGIAGNTLITDQMGLGKTLTAIEIAKSIFSKYDAPCLVICPKGIREQWRAMILTQDPNAKISILQTEVDVAYHQYHELDYIIVHYEMVVKEIKTLEKVPYSTIIVDEVHRIKTRITQSRKIKQKRGEVGIHRTDAVKRLRAYRKIGLTGTPYDKFATELWSILNWINPKVFSAYWRFVETYFDYETDYWGYKKNYTIKDPKTFAQMLEPYVLGRKKRDVLPELPPIQFTHIPITLNPNQRKAYEQIRKIKDLETTIDDQEIVVKSGLAKLTKLHQLASDPFNLNLSISSAKLDWLLEWFADNPTTPTLVFTRYRKTAEHLAQALLADTLVMGGSELTKPLSASQRIVATIGAMAVGYDLGHIDTTIFVDQDYDSILMAQAIERMDRGGNTEPKQVIYLEAQNTVDTLVRASVENKFSQREMIAQFLREVNQ